MPAGAALTGASAMGAGEAVLTIVGLVGITLATRGFFLLPQRDWPLPGWLREGLRHAPIGALVAVVAPDLLLTQGRLVASWHDAKLVGAAVAVAGVFPAGSHPAISYPAAVVGAHDSAEARAFLAFLKTSTAKDIFKRYGFTAP